MQTSPPWIVLAQVLRPQGRKGEVLADLFTDFPERFEERTKVWLAPPEFAGPACDARAAKVASFWLPVGKNAGRIVLHFEGVDRIEDAELLVGKQVVVPFEERVPLEEYADADSAYISDLIGCTVFDGAVAIGTIESVQFPATPDGTRRLEDAAPLLAIASSEGDEVLVPFAKAFLVDVDLPAKVIRMSLPEGLLQVNR
jgi:16S rRNA processing protein RimM